MSVRPTRIADATQEPTFPSLAREALSAHDGDTFAATNALVARLQGDVKLLRAIIDVIVRNAVDDKVTHAMRHRRESVVRAATSQGRGAVIALANGISNALLDFPLAGGKRLREAGRDDVLKQAEFYGRASKDMSHKSRWLTVIAGLLTDENTVGDVLTEDRALELWKEAGR